MSIDVSFIIPTLNEEKYIGRCIRSIGRAKNTEIFVVDTHSKDATAKIARKLGAKVFFEKKKGPGAARNTGARRARGRILIFADADVMFALNFASILKKTFGSDIGGCIFKLYPYDATKTSEKISYDFVNFWVEVFNKM